MGATVDLTEAGGAARDWAVDGAGVRVAEWESVALPGGEVRRGWPFYYVDLDGAVRLLWLDSVAWETPFDDGGPTDLIDMHRGRWGAHRCRGSRASAVRAALDSARAERERADVAALQASDRVAMYESEIAEADARRAVTP